MNNRKTFNVWINQCPECTDISQVNVRNFENIKEMETVEEAVTMKFFSGTEEEFRNCWPAPEFNRVHETRGFKGNNYSGTMTIKFKKFVVFAEAEFHKCSECGGNY